MLSLLAWAGCLPSKPHNLDLTCKLSGKVLAVLNVQKLDKLVVLNLRKQAARLMAHPRNLTWRCMTIKCCTLPCGKTRAEAMWNEDLVSEVVQKVYCPYYEDWRPNTLPRLWLVVPNNHSKLLPEVRFVRTGLAPSNARIINCLGIGRSIPKAKQKALDISHALHIPELRSLCVQQVNLKACTDWSIPPLRVVSLEHTKLACLPRFPSTLRVLEIRDVKVLDQAVHENILVGLSGQDLPNLIKLVVNGCSQRSSIPSTISKLKALKQLDLQNNLLSGTIPTSIGDLTSLEILNLSHNCLEGIIPTETREVDSPGRTFACTQQAGRLRLLDARCERFLCSTQQALRCLSRHEQPTRTKETCLTTRPSFNDETCARTCA